MMRMMERIDAFVVELKTEFIELQGAPTNIQNASAVRLKRHLVLHESVCRFLNRDYRSAPNGLLELH